MAFPAYSLFPFRRTGAYYFLWVFSKCSHMLFSSNEGESVRLSECNKHIQRPDLHKAN